MPDECWTHYEYQRLWCMLQKSCWERAELGHHQAPTTSLLGGRGDKTSLIPVPTTANTSAILPPLLPFLQHVWVGIKYSDLTTTPFSINWPIVQQSISYVSCRKTQLSDAMLVAATTHLFRQPHPALLSLVGGQAGAQTSPSTGDAAPGT